MSLQELPAKSKRANKLLAVRINGHRTTLRLFDSEISALDRICSESEISLDEFCTRAASDPDRPEHTLTAKVRGAMVNFLMEQWQPG
jgi:predicted DNA-binding ribbon-helix-helix protein